ncbi:MAG TPA: L-lactate dehydrogenase [Propionibacterium sp.]|nr:L-lactate dehydrogenase [Propionibacterium sp.]
MKASIGNRIVLIGAGDVGIAYGYALVNQGLADHLSIIDIDHEKLVGEVMDLNHGVVWAPSPTLVTEGAYADCADATMVVICAGAAQKPGETRLDLVGRNMTIFEGIVGQVMDSGFDGILLVATNPVDILTQATWRFSGLPSAQVIGSGTILDSARFRFMLGEFYDVAPMSVHASIIGEHGDTELPVFSSANVSGVPLRRDLDGDPAKRERLAQIFAETRDAAYRIIDSKGSTSYGIGMGLARITRAVLRNEQVSLPVSTLLRGEYGQDGLYIGVPAVIGRTGVQRVVELELDATEREQFAASAAALRSVSDRFDILR